MIIKIIGEQEFIKTAETTVSDARRVYISWVKESVTTENKYVEHLKYDKSSDSYISIGKVYMTKEQPIILKKEPSDALKSNVGSNVISATPIFNR